MQVRSVMNRDVKTIEPTKTAKQAAVLMTSFSIGSLVVVKDKKLAGIVTERDILTKIVAKDRPATTAVEKIMTRDVIYVKPDLDIDDAIKIMTDRKIKKLPVVSGSTLIGIVSVSDLLKAQPALMEKLGQIFFVPKKTVAG